MDSLAIVVFGGTGDLAKRKLAGALYNLFQHRLLPKRVTIIGFARSEMSHRQYAALLKEAIQTYTKINVNKSWSLFAKNIYYVSGDFSEQNAYDKLSQLLESLGQKPQQENKVLYYMATPPQAFGPISSCLQKAGLTRRDNGWPRVICEKPFGHDASSAKKLNADIKKGFAEDQIYRIDHYLGKETLQNILIFRFANTIFENLWNNRYIDHIQITASEDMGVGDRASYYDHAGALRDMIQNHLLQMLMLVAMEVPSHTTPEAIKNEKVKVLESLTISDLRNSVVRGQYGAGKVMGKHVKGYRQEQDIPKDSTTETFVALKAQLHNWRWEGVPFYLRTGKYLPKKSTEIYIQFKKQPCILFAEKQCGTIPPNALAIRVQPKEGIGLTLLAKSPGIGMKLTPVLMDFCHECLFSPNTPEAYERLMYDAIQGDATLFTRWDEVSSAWAFVDQINKGWKRQHPTFPNYVPGSWGPKQADELIQRDGRMWHEPGASP